MFGKAVVKDMIERSSANEADRRVFLKAAGVAGLGTLGAGAALAATTESAGAAGAITDGAILNFALNLEYLEAEFYNFAAFGRGLPDHKTGGLGKHGGVKGGRQVSFTTRAIQRYAEEIAGDEQDHVRFLRKALGSAKVARPALDIQASFTAAATAAGLIQAGQTFDPYANEDNFLLAAFLFEDVGVTAYKGAAPLISNKTYLEAAAGILAVEAYHAGIIRSALYQKGMYDEVKKLSAARDFLGGKANNDVGIGNANKSNIVPTNRNGLAFGRNAPDVLNIVYLTEKKASRGGFFPKGVNGLIHTSDDRHKRN